MELEKFIRKYTISDKLLSFCILSGLQAINEEDEDELKEDIMKKFNLTEENLDKMINEISDVSWKV